MAETENDLLNLLRTEDDDTEANDLLDLLRTDKQEPPAVDAGADNEVGEPVSNQTGLPVAPIPEPPPVTYQQWQEMSRTEREAAGLPVSTIGGANYFNRFGVGLGMNDPETGERIRSVPAFPPAVEEFVGTAVRQGILQEPREPSGDGSFRQFTSDMYDDEETFMSAMEEFAEIYNSPNTSRPLFGLGYAVQTNPETGERTSVFPPSRRLFGEGAKAGFLDLVATGGMDAVGNLVDLAGAVVERLGVEGASDFVSDNIRDPLFPQANTGESTMDALVSEGIPVLASSLVVAGLAVRATQGLGILARGTAAYVGGELGVAATSENDAGTLITGDQAMFPILNGVDLEGGDANEIIEARLTVLADGLLTGGILSGTMLGTAKALRLAYGLSLGPAVNILFRGDSGIEDELINRVLSQLTDELTRNMSRADRADPNIRFQISERIAEIVSNNRQVLVPYLNNLEKDLPIDLDSMSALIRGLDSRQDGLAVARAEGLRSGTIQSNGTMTLNRVNQPARTLDDETRAFLESVGGETAADQTATMARSADELAETGRREVLDAQGDLDAARAAYERSSTELVADLANDIELSDEIRRLSQATGTEIDVPRTASREQIRDQIETAYAQMRSTKNSLYAAIEGGPIDTGALYDVLANVSLDELSRQATSLQRTSPLREIAELFQPRMVPDTTASDAVDLTVGALPGSQSMRQETRDEVIERVNIWFSRDTEMYNFGFFQNVIRPELSTLASDLFARSDSTAGKVVRQIVHTIDTDMVDFVARTDSNLADAAVEAKRYYEEEFAPMFRDGKLADFSDLYDGTVARDINAVDFRGGSRDIIDNTIRSGNAAFIGQFRDLLARSEAGADPSPLASYMVADTISKAADALRTSGGTDAQLGGFIGQLRQYGEALNELFPAQAAELNDFIRQIDAAQGDRARLQRVMDVAQETVEDTLDDVRNGELSAFFRRETGPRDNPLLRNLATASDPQAAFRSVILSNLNDTTATVQALVDRASSLPPEQRQVVMDGMQTAYMRLFRDQVMPRRRGLADFREASPVKIEMGLEEATSVFNVGDVIFRDTPEFMDALRTISEVAGVTAASRNATPIPAVSATEFNRQVTTATNRIIYTLIGPLSRTGTRVRSAVGAFVERNGPDARAKEIMDRIMGDPAYFAQLARQYNRQPNDQQAQQMLLQALIPAYIRPTADEEGGDGTYLDGMIGLDRETRDAFGP